MKGPLMFAYLRAAISAMWARFVSALKRTINRGGGVGEEQ